MKSTGFTLLELLLVLTIILVLGGTSGVFYARFLNQNAVVTTTDQLINQLRKAQTYAMEGKQQSTWGVRFQNGNLTLFSTSSSAFDESFAVSSATSVTGLTQVVFSGPKGIPDATPTITVTSNGTTDTIAINGLGMISRN